MFKCPKCGSENLEKRGYDTQNKQKYHCRDCGCYPTEGAKRNRDKEDIKPKDDVLIRVLSTGLFSIEELSNKTGIVPKEVRRIIQDLEDRKYNINYVEDKIELAKDIKPGNTQKLNIEYWKGDRIKVGFVSDTHLCSKFERLAELNLIYDVFTDEGIELVYHGGNYIDGENKFNKYEIHTRGITPQVEYFINNYPKREGILTKFICGDDHEGWIAQRERLNVGEYTQMKAIEAGRRDLEYIGYLECDIPFEGIEGKSWLRVMHGGGGTAYALSYTPQKIVESLQGGEKPRILLLGHYHKIDYCFPREVHVIQMGCFQDQTTWLRKKKIQCHIGGGILRMNLAKDGTINRIMPEFITFFNKKFYVGNDKYWIK
ncbi:hypothetical protein CVT91_00135 [Candidatus Atribacteria bacterium HGW-Atribacteria-1]|nr:MAG: hypothetical protein CVT91_00135 [Candidatus Atribacteria bacterium HGW-Atribacteria-1]